MQEPLQIAFHNMASSPALEQRVRELFDRLERYYDGIISARVVLEAPHKQAHKSTLGISISIGVPGRDIVVKREQRIHEADNHNVWVLTEAFEAAGRQIEEYSRIRRRDVKAPEPGQRYARVVRLYPEQDYGFIETPDGQNVYFHRAVVRDDKYDALEVGSEVIYTPADQEGSMGPMASNIQLIRGNHPIR
jgi:cold shock CspA family protein/ribosome-associated translation inhibitor RaiA